MAKRFTHTACFQHFGTKPKNVQWSWSARNEQTGVVAVTLWRDEFKKSSNGLTYERGPLPEGERRRPGHTELMENLRWSLDNADGRIHVIIAVAQDEKAAPRTIKSCAPTNMVAWVRELDVVKGSFRIEANL